MERVYRGLVIFFLAAITWLLANSSFTSSSEVILIKMAGLLGMGLGLILIALSDPRSPRR